jgi:hypothetical protein
MDPTEAGCPSNCAKGNTFQAASCSGDWVPPSHLSGNYSHLQGACAKDWYECDPSTDANGCQSTACQLAQMHDPTAPCLPAMILYACPFVGALVSILFGYLAIQLARSVRETESSPTELNPVFKVAFISGFFGLTVMWLAASIAGASMNLSQLVMAFGLVCVGLMVLTLVSMVGVSAFHEEVHKVPLVAAVEQFTLHSDFSKGFVLLFGGPILPVYFFISFLNQLARIYLPCTKILENDPTVPWDERRLTFTLIGHKQWLRLCKWRWSIVLDKMVLWGVIIFVLKVGAGTVTTMALAQLNAKLVRDIPTR